LADLSANRLIRLVVPADNWLSHEQDPSNEERQPRLGKAETAEKAFCG